MIPDSLKDSPVAAALENRDTAWLTGGSLERGELTLQVDSARIVDICRFLKKEQGFERFSSITALDWYPRAPRFEVVYLLYSISKKQRLRLKARVEEDSAEIDSVCEVWRGADWYEREVFDMFGIRFRNHPDLRRILMPDDWDGYPLRKDYPIHGHKYSYRNE